MPSLIDELKDIHPVNDPRVTDPAYTSPSVEIGQVVQFRFSPSQRWRPALVVKSGGRETALNVYDENGNYRFYDSVRHRTDPDLVRPQIAERGFWDFTDRDKKIDALIAKEESRGKKAIDLPTKKEES